MTSASTSSLAPVTRTLVIVMLLVAVAAGVARILPQPRTIDDAFITFRYSRNLVEGEGFVYNPGTHTLGTTTPLYTLIMAAVSALTGSDRYPWIALYVNALVDAASAVLLAWLAYRPTGSSLLAAVAGLVWAFNPISVTFAIGGMETSLGIFWAMAATVLYVERHERWMALCAALAILTRIDTVIWVGPLLLHQWFLRWRGAGSPRGLHALVRSLPWGSWAVFVGALLPWFAFSLVYFGSPLPNSLGAKQVAYQVESLQALLRLLQHIATPFAEHHAFGSYGIMIGIVTYPALAGAGTLFALRRMPRVLPYVLYPWVYIAVFSVFNPLMFRWYVAPITPAYILAVLFGVWGLGEAALLRRGRAVLHTGVLAVAGTLFVLLTLNAWRLHPTHGPDRPAPQMAWHEIELQYRHVGERLREHYGVTDATLVAAGDIGAIGYYTRARILDTVGLVTPELSAYYPVGEQYREAGASYIVPPEMLFDFEPAYFVIMRGYIHDSLYEDDEFNALYELVESIPTDYYGNAMLVYEHRERGAETPLAGRQTVPHSENSSD